MTEQISPNTEFVTCPRCGKPYDPRHSECPHCTLAVSPDSTQFTRPLNHFPTTIPTTGNGTNELDASTVIIIQALPSGTCIPLPARKATILGRAADTGIPPDTALVSLDDLDAQGHGVSRQHCLIEHSGSQLWVTDLGSTNGTYLNDQQLEPYRQYMLANGDRLILGTLHLAVCFEHPAF